MIELVGNAATIKQLADGDDPAAIVAGWNEGHRSVSQDAREISAVPMSASWKQDFVTRRHADGFRRYAHRRETPATKSDASKNRSVINCEA